MKRVTVKKRQREVVIWGIPTPIEIDQSNLYSFTRVQNAVLKCFA